MNKYGHEMVDRYPFFASRHLDKDSFSVIIE
jgi:hypothetical protein